MNQAISIQPAYPGSHIKALVFEWEQGPNIRGLHCPYCEIELRDPVKMVRFLEEALVNLRREITKDTTP
jgi:hypothetical protein